MTQRMVALKVPRERIDKILNEIHNARLNNGEIIALAIYLINHVAQSCEDRETAEYLLKSVGETFASAKVVPNPFYGQDESNIPTC